MKKDGRPTLTIAIPTYNGEKYIKDALDSIILQLPVNLHRIDDIEILISDNASTDDVPEISALYKKNYPNIVTYYRLPMTLHPDNNFDFAVRNARGKYVWLLSDDDALLPGSIEKVLNVINHNKDIAVIFANYRTYNSDLSKQIGSDVLTLRGDMVCPPGDTYFLRTEGRNSLVSSVIVRRELWENADTVKLMGTHWVHFGAVLQIAAKAPSYIISTPIVKMRNAKARGPKGIIFFAQLNLFQIFKNLPRWGYNNSTAKKATRGLHKQIARTIIARKADSFKFDKILLNKFFASYKKYPSFWVVDLPLIFLPTIFHKAVYLSYKKSMSLTENLTSRASLK